MGSVGIETKNIDPFADLAEVLVADAFEGKIQPRANKGFDVLTENSLKIQVKSLRISSDRPADNGLDWIVCTRIGSKLSSNSALIDADKLAVVLFLDFFPHSITAFPVARINAFPVIGVKGIGFKHLNYLLTQKNNLEGNEVSVVDLRDRLKK